MRRDYICLGPTPPEELCAPIEDRRRCNFEGQCYIEQLVRQFGEPPETARLTVQWFPHDFGSYPEVVCYYEDQESLNYAFKCESESWSEWDETSKAKLATLEALDVEHHPLSIGAVLKDKERWQLEEEYMSSLTDEQLESMSMDMENVVCADGCVVEPDGHCQHGFTSPLLLKGIV